MKIYEKNLQVLAKYYPEMDKMIEEARKKMPSEVEVLEELSYEGVPILIVKKGSKVYYLNGKRNTIEAAQMWVETLGKLQTNAPVLIVGVGNPFYLQELVEKTKNRITIVVYEPSLQIFLKFLEMVNLEPWMEKHLLVFWVNGIEKMDESHMKGILQKILTYEMLNFSRHFILPNYDKLFPEESLEFIKMCRDIALKETMQFNTKDVFSEVMVKNLLLNSKYLCDGYKTTQLLDIVPRDIPGIVVAAGPSLNKNIQELKRAKGKAFIVAVDTAIRPLLGAGIVPDMFAIIDAMKPVELIKMEEAKDIPLLTTLNASPEVLEYHQGKKFFFNEGYQFAEEIFLKSGHRAGDVACGGSVATSIFSLLYKIAIDTIILVGQDLAYTNNKSHADGTFHEFMEQEDTSGFRMVEGNYEEKVPTRSDFKMYIDWYNDYIKGAKEYREKFRVINATEGGAKIKNTEIMSLKEAIDKECIQDVNIQECLDKIPPMLNEEKRAWTVDYLKNIPNEFQKLSSEVRILKKSYQKLDKICNKKNIDKKEYLSIYKELEKRIQTVEKINVYQLIVMTMSNAMYILRNEQFLQKDSIQKEGKEIARKGILYTENVISMSNLFKEYAEEIFIEDKLKERRDL